MYKTLKHIVRGVVWMLIGIFISLVIAINIGTVQRYIGQETGKALSRLLGTEVRLGRVDLGLFNRLIIDDVTMKDQKGKQMLKASRMSVKLNLYALLTSGKIEIYSAQLFGADARMYQETADAKPNFQFVVDSLSSDGPKKKLDLSIGSVMIRHTNVSWDRLDMPRKATIDVNHLGIKELSAQVMIPVLTDDSLKAEVRKLSFKERSGLDLRKLSMEIEASKTGAEIRHLVVNLPNTSLQSERVWAAYNINDKGGLEKGSLRYGTTLSLDIRPSDLSFLDAALSRFDKSASLDLSLEGSAQDLNLTSLRLESSDGDISMQGSAKLTGLGSSPAWDVSIGRLNVAERVVSNWSPWLRERGIVIPEQVIALGSISFKGSTKGNASEVSAEGDIRTDAGSARFNVKRSADGTIGGHLTTEDINLGRILGTDKLGILAADVDARTRIVGGKPQSVEAKGEVKRFFFNGYEYRNITLDGTYAQNVIKGRFAMDETNGLVDVDGEVMLGSRITARGTADIKHLCLGAMNIDTPLKKTVLDGHITADVTGSSLEDILGKVAVEGLSMRSDRLDYRLQQLDVNVEQCAEGKHLVVSGDPGFIDIRGKFNYATLPGSLTNVVSDRLPTLPGLKHVNGTDNRFSIDATITRTDWLKTFFGIDLDIPESLTINGLIDDRTRSLDMNVNMPAFNHKDTQLRDLTLKMYTEGDVLKGNASGYKVSDDGHRFYATLDFDAADNYLNSQIRLSGSAVNDLQGVLNTSTQFFMSDDGNASAHVNVHPSEFIIAGDTWKVEPSDIVYRDGKVIVDYLGAMHDKQYISLTGKASDNPDDVLTAKLKDIDVKHILDLVRFTSVRFDGLASGMATVKGALSSAPDARASLEVSNFRFENGRMGTLHADASWNHEQKQIDIDAYTDDELGYVATDGKDCDESHTYIKGYVSPARNFIDLGIEASNTRIEFLESFCSSFMGGVEAWANGKVRLAGDLKNINLTGDLRANGKLDITTLGTTYTIKDIPVHLIPDEIMLTGDTVRDNRGGYGVVRGALHHKHLTKLTFDMDIDVNNMLSMYLPTYGKNTFYGTVIGTGNCKIKGRPGNITLDVDATANKGSFIEYNAASPDAITNQEFITWRDVTPRTDADSLATDSVVFGGVAVNGIHPKEETLRNISSDIKMNLKIKATPDFTLRVLMDKASGDCIYLNGNGELRANWFNKGGFEMYGNYLVDHGQYRLTIQNVLKKVFEFQPGGTITFGGDPYSAMLNLKAMYTLNSVPLSDLRIGGSFAKNNIRVDCLMNITGTPEEPQVSFGLDLPTQGSDAKQMVLSVLNGEEEVNQQVIYLLSIGRFNLSQANNAGSDGEQRSQTSLAMQSFLSGTVSQQINNMLGQLVKSNNWNFGANISTGDEGWNNAEYEGLMSGSLLNDRLLINGQFGYRDNATTANTSFIGDFDIRYLLFPSGNLSIKVYNQTNDRYFTKSSLNTQGIGLLMKKDFSSWKDLFRKKRNPRNIRNSNR